MKKDKKNILILLGILIGLILVLQNNYEVKVSIIEGTELWLTKVFPSLFPMFILSELLMNYHLPEILANLFGKPFCTLFKTSPYGIFTFFMSLIAGTPSSAYIVKNLVEEQKLTEKEASHLLMFTFFSNPLFLITMLSLLFPNSTQVLLIILIHYCANLIIGFIMRPKETIKWKKIKYTKPQQSLGTILASAIQKSMNTLLLILGTICFYLMISTILKTSNPFGNTLLKGFLELTQGLNSLIKANYSPQIKSILALSFISFGGLSIHTQIKSIISDTSISYLSFLKGRILHVILSLLLWLSYTGITFIT